MRTIFLGTKAVTTKQSHCTCSAKTVQTLVTRHAEWKTWSWQGVLLGMPHLCTGTVLMLQDSNALACSEPRWDGGMYAG